MSTNIPTHSPEARAKPSPPDAQDSPLSPRERAFRKLVDAHYETLWSYASFLTRNRHATEDVTHQAFLIAFDRIAAGRAPTGDSGRWLRGVARNLVKRWWRERRKLAQDVVDALGEVLDAADHAATQVQQVELNHALAVCLDKLKAEDRRLISLRYADGRRITAIAEQSYQNAATLRVRLHRLRNALRKCVEKRTAGGTPA